jgi:serine/threonine protein kinase
MERYELGGVIGKGSYAVVKSAHDTHKNIKVAIKIYDKFRLVDP